MTALLLKMTISEREQDGKGDRRPLIKIVDLQEYRAGTGPYMDLERVR
jgi:hypothetical protein